MNEYRNLKILTVGALAALITIYFTISSINKKLELSEDKINPTPPPLVLGGEFELTDTHGQLVDSKSLNGKPTLLYFGFTYCPDVCVASLHKINFVLNILDKYQIKVNPVFITVDPKRDTSQVLEAYFKHFHKNFIALSGNEEQIKEVADKYKVYYAVSGDKNSKDYMINHSTFIYLLDKDGKYLTYFPLESKAEDIVEYIRVNCG